LISEFVSVKISERDVTAMAEKEEEGEEFFWTSAFNDTWGICSAKSVMEPASST
jgi:hypothetical protein